MGKVKEKISSTMTKISKRADVLGAVIGYGMTCDSVLKLLGSTNWINDFATIHVNAVTRHNFQNVPDNFAPTMTAHAPLLLGATAMLGGFIGGMLPSFIPSQGPICSIAKKAGFGMLVGGAVASVVTSLAAGSSPLGGIGGSGSGAGTATTSGRIPYPMTQAAHYVTDGTGRWKVPAQ